MKVAKKKENEGGDKDRAHSLYKILKKNKIKSYKDVESGFKAYITLD